MPTDHSRELAKALEGLNRIEQHYDPDLDVYMGRPGEKVDHWATDDVLASHFQGDILVFSINIPHGGDLHAVAIFDYEGELDALEPILRTLTISFDSYINTWVFNDRDLLFAKVTGDGVDDDLQLTKGTADAS